MKNNYKNREISIETLKKDYEKFKLQLTRKRDYPKANGLKKAI